MFFDENDALVSARSETGDSSGGVQQRILAALLNEMDGIDRVAGILVVSNRTFFLNTDIVGTGACFWVRLAGTPVLGHHKIYCACAMP